MYPLYLYLRILCISTHALLPYVHGTQKAAMKSWRFPETRQGGNMRNIYDHQGSAKRKGTFASLAAWLSSMCAIMVCMEKETICSSKTRRVRNYANNAYIATSSQVL